MSEPYREPAEIAAEIPPAPREPWWTYGRQAAAWIIFGVLCIDAIVTAAHWPIHERGGVAVVAALHVIGLVIWRVITVIVRGAVR